MSASFLFSEPGRFTVGAMGQPGRRVFYLQAFGDGAEVAVKCEKQQAQALAEHLVGLLADLPGSDDDPVAPAEALPPGDLAFTVGSISIGIDRSANRLIVLAEELVIPDDDDDDPSPTAGDDNEPARLRVHLTRDQVRAFAGQVDALVADSRPLCRLCEQPIDPDGHACPRLN